MCVCPEAINYIHVILNDNKLRSFSMFQNVSINRHGLSNEAHHDSNKAIVL